MTIHRYQLLITNCQKRPRNWISKLEIRNSDLPRPAGHPGFFFLLIPVIFFVIALIGLAIALTGRAQLGDDPTLKKATSATIDGLDTGRGKEIKIGRLTGYIPCLAGDHPKIISMQAGEVANCDKDRFGQPLYTLQEYLAGRAPYVSVAGSEQMYKDYPYDNKTKLGHPIRIPKIEEQYKAELERSGRKNIIFRLVDTGSAFTTAGYSKMDIHVARGISSPVDVNSGPRFNELLKNAYAIDGPASAIFIDTTPVTTPVTGKAPPVN